MNHVDALLATFERVAAEPHIVAHLRVLAGYQRDPKTLRAYVSDFNDFLAWADAELLFSKIENIEEEEVAQWVQFMADGDDKRDDKRQVRHLHGGTVLANATIRRRLSALRGLYDYLQRKGVVQIHPVPGGRQGIKSQMGSNTPRRRSPGFGGRPSPLPWIPSDQQWETLLRTLRAFPRRDRMMVALAYDLALRRETIVGLELSDYDFSSREITIRPEIVKNGSTPGTLRLSEPTGAVFMGYLPELKELEHRSRKKCGRIFRSTSDRNLGGSLHVSSVNVIVSKLRVAAGLPQFTPHTMRHLRLTHMARAGLELYDIKQWAGHQSVSSTELYIQLSGRHLGEKMAKNMKLLNDKLAQLAEVAQ